jgi:hypothetical protein
MFCNELARIADVNNWRIVYTYMGFNGTLHSYQVYLMADHTVVVQGTGTSVNNKNSARELSAYNAVRKYSALRRAIYKTQLRKCEK